MTVHLAERVLDTLATPIRIEVRALARRLGEESGALGVLFYGSNLRTGSLDGVLDFYVLLPGPQDDLVWPRIGYREEQAGGNRLRAKTATMSLAKFAEAAAGQTLDTTIWARFAQPSALAYVRDDDAELAIAEALAAASMTAARMAAVLGPAKAPAEAFWRALFRRTYRAEFRVEKQGREDSILAVNRAHFDGLLGAAWEAQGLPYRKDGTGLAPDLAPGRRAALLAAWRRRERLGKPLNLVRLARAALTFEGAADYAAWKLERHTGIALEVTPFRAAHPLLAMPGAAFDLWRARRRRKGA
ncbi:hypothetical protein [Qipengyuania sp.]|uniref:hypothetical protein n=1 Tax=Qipengyuania sp. TaxID=2004515 RepID=UPI003736590D